MTYADELKKTEQQALPELFVFQSGANIERVTSFNQPIVFQGFLFKPGNVKRTGFQIDSTLGAVKVTIAAPLDTSFGRYIANLPIEPARVKIYRTVAGDLTAWAVFFSGKVLGVSFRDRVANAVCQNKSSVLDALIPNVVYQAQCNYQLFDTGCKLNDSAYMVTAAVTEINGATLKLSGLTGFADNYFQGGFLTCDTDMRLITKQIADSVTLQLPFDERLKVGSTVWAYPGCDGSAETCKNKFGNFDNCLGMFLIPSSNPVFWGV